MPTALHPQTQLTLKFDHQCCRGIRLSDEDSHPHQARLQESEIRDRHLGQNTDAGGYWENQGYNWFSGL